MKIFFILIFLSSTSFTSHAQDRDIPIDQIPKKITTYLETHFPDNAVLEASFDDHVVYKKYEIFLEDRVSLEFSPEYKVMEIKSKSKLPDAVIPKQILKYVEINCPKNVITDWELDDGNQQIELDNGIDMEFDLKGKFIRAED